MSYIFDVGASTVWSPALSVGAVYVALAEAIAKRLGVPSGLIAEAQDMYDIDPVAFATCVEIVDSELTGHSVGAALVDGFLATGVVLMRRGGFGDNLAADLSGRLSTDPIELAKKMPR